MKELSLLWMIGRERERKKKKEEREGEDPVPFTYTAADLLSSFLSLYPLHKKDHHIQREKRLCLSTTTISRSKRVR